MSLSPNLQTQMSCRATANQFEKEKKPKKTTRNKFLHVGEQYKRMTRQINEKQKDKITATK